MSDHLNRTGSVGTVTSAPQGGSYCQTIWWNNLNAFSRGYIEALFASICPEEDGSRPILQASFSDIAPETLARIIADCAAFPSWSGRCDHSSHGGEVFFAQRQRGQWPDSFPPLTITLGDNGKVRAA